MSVHTRRPVCMLPDGSGVANPQAEAQSPRRPTLTDPMPEPRRIAAGSAEHGRSTGFPFLLLALVLLVAGCAGIALPNVGGAAPSLADVPEVTPRPTPDFKLPKTYAKLAKADWTRALDAAEKTVAKGYQVWACITQFDTATGRESFRAAASDRREPSWSRLATNAYFNGTETQLATISPGDVVQMNVVGLGPFAYPTKANGSTTLPTFFVTKIAKKGSCG
jgi:hypothetical protein